MRISSFYIMLCVLFCASLWGCRPRLPPRPGAGAGSRLSTQIRSRLCPNQLAFSPDGVTTRSKFSGTPCELSKPLDECLERCLSFLGNQLSESGETFWQRCSDEEVLCVGAEREVKTLQDVVAKFKANPRINRILLDRGTYVGGIVLAGFQRSLTIEGISNHPRDGVIIEGPAWSKGALTPEAGALVFRNGPAVVLRRLVITGERHGLVISKVQKVGLDGLFIQNNKGHGALVTNADTVDISRSSWSFNGMPADGVPKKDALCRFGLAIDATSQVSVETSMFSRNGAGGLRVGTDAMLGSGERCERIRVDMGVALPTSRRAVKLMSNVFIQNGPSGWQSTNGSDDCDKCGANSLCERGRCLPALQRKDGTKVSVIGVGAVIAGGLSATVEGNTFHQNDAMGLVLHTVSRALVVQNAVSQNGLRPKASDEATTAHAMPAILLFDILQTLSINHNLIVDNVATGLRYDHTIRPFQVSVSGVGNHVSGNGRFAKQRTESGGSGMLFAAPQKEHRLILDLNGNYFAANDRAGLWLSGGMNAELTGNYLENQFGFGVVIRDTGEEKRFVFELLKNTIKGARSCGIQIGGGSARVVLDANLVRDIKPTKDAKDGAPADGIQISSLRGSGAILVGNKVSNANRAALVVHNAQAELKNNALEAKAPGHSIVLQEKGAQSGGDKEAVHVPPKPLPLKDTP